MADTVVELLAKRIKARLETITPANGYDHTVARVIRPSRIEGSQHQGYADLDIVLLQEGRARNDGFNDGSPPATGWTQSFTVVGFRIITDASTASIDEAVNNFAGDIEEALTRDVQWDNGSGTKLAVDSRIMNVDPLESDSAQVSGCVISFDVDIRTQENDPRVNRVG